MRGVGDDAVILDLEAGKYFGLNDVGAEVWKLLEAGSTLSDINATLVTEFDIDEKTLDGDTTKLLESLLAAGLVVEA